MRNVEARPPDRSVASHGVSFADPLLLGARAPLPRPLQRRRHSACVIPRTQCSQASLSHGRVRSAAISPPIEKPVNGMAEVLSSPRNSASIGKEQALSITLDKPVVCYTQSEETERIRAGVRELVGARGALGRGVRALLRALCRRARPSLEAAKDGKEIYVEFCAAYVRATAGATRYAVEQRAWPAMQKLLEWRECSTTDARAERAALRRLKPGTRYGRHIFIGYHHLAAAIFVADEMLVDTAEDPENETNSGTSRRRSLVGSEYVVDLPRMPLPRQRSIAARCPRHKHHSNGDRTPSLILWMNTDGVTGGALCPVCTESSSNQLDRGIARNMTWRVRYLDGSRALLTTPQSRIPVPNEVDRALGGSSSNAEEIPVGSSREFGTDETSVSSVSDSESCTKSSVVTSANTKTAAKEPEPAGAGEPVGGCVLQDERRRSQLGSVTSQAYVMAKLKVVAEITDDHDYELLPDTAGDLGSGTTRVRTVGTMSQRRSPLQVMMWSDKVSKGASVTRRVADIAWYAAQKAILDSKSSAESEDDDALGGGDGDVSPDAGDPTAWLPTNVLSVSTMKPSGWREIQVSSGRFVSIPSGWEPSAQEWVLFDIDDLDGLLETDAGDAESSQDVSAKVQAIGTSLVRVIRRAQDLSGVCVVMQTGPRGLHVWAELREPRGDARSWFANGATRAWYAQVGARLLRAARRSGASSGVVDMSSCSAGRFGRRPGWRILRDGKPFRSRVVTVASSRVKKRVPRLNTFASSDHS